MVTRDTSALPGRPGSARTIAGTSTERPRPSTCRKNPVTVNAVPRNDDRFHSIMETMRLLGYEPRDSAAEVLDS